MCVCVCVYVCVFVCMYVCECVCVFLIIQSICYISAVHLFPLHREVDSTYIQQEALLRQRYAIQELTYGAHGATGHVVHPDLAADRSPKGPHRGAAADDLGAAFLHEGHGHCPSSWHTAADRHSPVFPQHHLPHQPHHGNRRYSSNSSSNNNTNNSTSNSDNKSRSYHDNRHVYHQSGWLAPPGGYQTNYQPAAFWDGSRDKYGGGYEKADDGYWSMASHVTSNTIAMDAMTTQYYMQFNGIGIAAHDVTNVAPQYPPSTLLIRGHVTAYDGQTGSANRLAGACAYAPVSADCAYGPLACYGSCVGDNLDCERPSCQYDLPNSAMTSGYSGSQDRSIKQEDASDAGHVTWTPSPHAHGYPHLRAASDVTYPTDDVIANLRPRPSCYL